MESTGESRDQASLHLGAYDDAGNAIPVQSDEPKSLEEQRAEHDAAYEPPDKSTWVTCLPGCHWADDGDGYQSWRARPKAIHDEGCPQTGSRYVESIPAPVR